MLFRLINTPASFQEFIDKTLAKKLNIFVILYLNDIFIYINDDGNSYVVAIWWVLELLKKFPLYFNPKKCRFYQEGLLLFRYVVSLRDIIIEDKRIKVVKLWPKPQSWQDN